MSVFLMNQGMHSLGSMVMGAFVAALRRGFWFGANVFRFDDAHRNHLLAIAPNQGKFIGMKIRSESAGSCGFSACPAQTFGQRYGVAQMCRVYGSDDKRVDERLAQHELDGWAGF